MKINWDALNSILGMNRRNIEYVYQMNRREDFPLVDDKILTKKVLAEHGISHVPLIAVFESFLDLDRLPEVLNSLHSFAMKPAQGYGGGGIIVVDHRDGADFITVTGKRVSLEKLIERATEILYGVYSIDSSMGDRVIIEEKIGRNEFMEHLSGPGVPDIRVIMCRQQLAMAMLRLPTEQSDGKANLHQGGVGVGIDLKTGLTTHTVSRKGPVLNHPDTGTNLIGVEIPQWKLLVELSIKVSQIFPLGYMGLDWVLDIGHIPRLLELNARPGLEIQNANRQGLRSILEGTVGQHA
jgi:alpha-L-glutamate ligase-like protein